MEPVDIIEPAEGMGPVDFTESDVMYQEDNSVNQLGYAGINDYIWSFLGVILIVSVFVIQQPDKLMHWMLLPLSLCGTIVGADAIRWIKGTYTLYDPKGMIGFYGINFFLIAPLLIVFYDMEGVETYIVTDWKPLLGLMAVFNFIGLIIYKLTEKFAFNRPSKVERTYWAVNPGRATFFVPVFVTVAVVSYGIYIVRLGGLGGVLLQESQGEVREGLTGGGIFLILRDALPLSVLIGLTINKMKKGIYENSSRWLWVGIGMLFLFILTSGLRGSRAAIGYGLICVGGIIHHFWKRLTMKTVLLSLIPLLIFFYFYSFYKSAGIIGIRGLLQGRISIRDLQESTSRTFSGMLIGDLSRAHIQAVELDVLVNRPWTYRYRFGTTYPLAVGYLIPRLIWRTKPLDMGRIIAGTEMLYGEGTYGETVKLGGVGSRSTQLYGLAGEAMLNFGVYGILPAFAVWGYVIGRIRKRLYSFRSGDMRLMMSGFWLLICNVMLVADADQIVWFFISLYIVPAILVYLISDKIELNAESI
jgi:hypothetical protein